MRSVVLDTSVMMDVFLKHRKKYPQAARLADLLIENAVKIIVPMHAFFEITSAIMCEKRLAGGKGVKGNEAISEERPLRIETVPIDLAFVNKYAIGEAPDLKSGDMIFVVLAKVDSMDLITEDSKMYNEAQRLGVSAFKINDYLQTWDAN